MVASRQKNFKTTNLIYWRSQQEYIGKILSSTANIPTATQSTSQEYPIFRAKGGGTMLNLFNNTTKQKLKDEHEPGSIFYLITSARNPKAERFVNLEFTIYIVIYHGCRQNKRTPTGTNTHSLKFSSLSLVFIKVLKISFCESKLGKHGWDQEAVPSSN